MIIIFLNHIQKKPHTADIYPNLIGIYTCGLVKNTGIIVNNRTTFNMNRTKFNYNRASLNNNCTIVN